MLGRYASFSEYHFWSRMMYFCGGVVIGLYHANCCHSWCSGAVGWLGWWCFLAAWAVVEMERTSSMNVPGTLFASQFLAPAVAYFMCLSLLVASWGQEWRGAAGLVDGWTAVAGYLHFAMGGVVYAGANRCGALSATHVSTATLFLNALLSCISCAAACQLCVSAVKAGKTASLYIWLWQVALVLNTQVVRDEQAR